MNAFNRISVPARLGWSFGVVLVLLLATLSMGLYCMDVIHGTLDTTINNRMPKIIHVDDLSDHASQNAQLVRDVILLTDEREMAQSKASFDRNVKLNEEEFAWLDQHLRQARSRDQLAQVQAAGRAFNAYARDVMALALANRNEEATKLLYGPGHKTQEVYSAAVQKLVELQREELKQEYALATTENNRARAIMVALGCLAALLGVALAVIITRGLTRQLGGEPSLAADVASAVARGDLTADIPLRGNDTDSMMAQLKAMQSRLADVVARVRQGAEGVSTASAEIASGNHDLSARTESQASALEQTAASMEELSSTVRQNADNAAQGDQLAKNASAVAQRGGEVVGQVVHTMKGIQASSQRIADIIGVIDGIAFQTNILALNAAVEAARAGEQGRGFAVVAGEVRTLAQRSAEAAKEIKSLITASVEQVEQGTALADQAGSTMAEVVTAIRRVTDIMGEISAASGEQAQGVAQVGEAVTQMDQVTQQNAALVEQMAAAASSLKTQSAELVQTVGVFRLEGPEVTRMPASASRQNAAPAANIATRAGIRRSDRGPAAGQDRREKAPKPVALAPKVALAGVAANGDWESF